MYRLDCAKCGYSLTGLASTGTCPECGLNVSDSITPRWEQIDPVWWRRLSAGSKTSLVALKWCTSICLALIGLAVVCILLFPQYPHHWLDTVGHIAMWFAVVPLALVASAGFWLLTTSRECDARSALWIVASRCIGVGIIPVIFCVYGLAIELESTAQRWSLEIALLVLALGLLCYLHVMELDRICETVQPNQQQPARGWRIRQGLPLFMGIGAAALSLIGSSEYSAKSVYFISVTWLILVLNRLGSIQTMLRLNKAGAYLKQDDAEPDDGGGGGSD